MQVIAKIIDALTKFGTFMYVKIDLSRFMFCENAAYFLLTLFILSFEKLKTLYFLSIYRCKQISEGLQVVSKRWAT